MDKSKILQIISEELKALTEVKVKKGDAIYDKSYDEYGVVNTVKGKVAYVKFTSTGSKSFDPVMLSSIKYKGKHKGKDLYITEAAPCSPQKNRIEEVETEDDTEFTVSINHLLKKHVSKGGKVKEGIVTEAEKYITNKFKVGDTIKLLKYNWKVTEVNFKPGKSYRDSFTFVDGKQVPIKSPPTNKNAIGYKLEDGSDSAFYHCYKSGSGKTIMKLAVKGFNESVNEALARGLKPLLTIGTKISSKVGENALVKLSDKFDRIDDEQADDIASHLNMGIELMQDESPSEARGWLKKFNKACKDALKGKSTKSAFEGVNESMIGIKTKANFKPLQLKGALDRAKIKGYQMNRLSVTLTALKLDKKDFDGAKKIIDDLGLKVMMAKESVNGEGKLTEATGVWKRFDAMQKLQGQAMDIEMDMKSITKDLKLAHREMEQEAEPEGGEIADRYADQIDKLEKEYKKKKVELKKVFAKLDKLEQF